MEHHRGRQYYEAETYERRARSKELIFKDRLDAIESAPCSSKGKTLVDFGCAAGHFLMGAKVRGFVPVGVEIATQLARVAARNVPCEVFPSIANVKEEGIRADVVHSSHSLEHVTDPVGVLREAFRILRPGGVLAIEVPNQFSAWTDRIKLLAFSLLGQHAAGRLVSEPADSLHHTFFYSATTLRRLVEQGGFRVDSLSTINPAYYKTTLIPPLRRILYKRLDRLFDLVDWGPCIVLFARKPVKLELSRQYQG